MAIRRKIPLPLKAAKEWLESRDIKTDDAMISNLASEFLWYFELGQDGI